MNETDTDLQEDIPQIDLDSKTADKPITKGWNAVDELCPICGTVTKPATGLTRQNLKKLFSFKMKLSDVITFLLLMMLLFSVYRYQNDTQQCRSFLDSGSAAEWNKMVASGISIDGLIEASKADIKLMPTSLPNGLKTNFTACTGTNLTGGNETTCQ